MTLAELVDEYLAQHDAEPVTIEKLRWLLGKALAAFGDRRLSELRPHEIAAWRMTITPGHRFEATQALRQVLARAVVWQMLTEGRTLRAAVSQLLREYDVSRDKLEADIACFIEALEIHGLVVRTTGEPEGEPA